MVKVTIPGEFVAWSFPDRAFAEKDGVCYVLPPLSSFGRGIVAHLRQSREDGAWREVPREVLKKALDDYYDTV